MNSPFKRYVEEIDDRYVARVSQDYGLVDRTINMLHAEILGVRKYDRDNSRPINKAAFRNYLYYTAAPWIRHTKRVSYDKVMEICNLNGSCGFPMSSYFNNKGDFFRHVNIHDEMRDYEEFVLSTDGPITYWVSFLKDEVVPTRKIKNPRQINCPGVHYYMLFMSFVSDYNDQWIDGFDREESSHAVGMDVFSLDWDKLMKKLLIYPLDFSIDHKAFDSTIIKEAFIAIWRYRSALMDLSEREFRLFKKCYECLADSLVLLADGSLVLVSGGNMSGSPTTTEDNTHWNEYTTSTCLTELDIKHSMVCYGDDSAIVTDTKVPFDDFVKSKFDKFGLVVKPEGSATGKPLKDRQIIFLSRKNIYLKNSGIDFSVSATPKKLFYSAFCTNTRSNSLRFQRLCGIREALYGNPVYFDILDKYVKELVASGRISTSDLACFRPRNFIYGGRIANRDQRVLKSAPEPFKNKICQLTQTVTPELK
jgi:hypothetical protein